MTTPSPQPINVLIAGGGVAGLEACLALRSFLDEPELAIELLCPEPRFEYRPLAVLEPFDGAPPWSMELATFAADQGVWRGCSTIMRSPSTAACAPSPPTPASSSSTTARASRLMRSSHCPGCAAARSRACPRTPRASSPSTSTAPSTGSTGVYAAGDVTTFPLKQGGLAAQQADAAAEAILAGLGVPLMPRPFEASCAACCTPTASPRTCARRRAAKRQHRAAGRCGGRRARSPAATSRRT